MASDMRVHDESGEAPLDPAQERLRRKLVRLLFVSGGIMFLGLIAVFAAIVYKLAESGEGAAGGRAPVEAEIALPAGAQLIATAFDGERALLTLSDPDGGTTLLLVDLRSGAVVGRYRIGE
jgi:hypothetical protein